MTLAAEKGYVELMDVLLSRYSLSLAYFFCLISYVAFELLLISLKRLFEWFEVE